MASLSTRLAPTVPTRFPGGIDLIATRMEAFRTGYVGECIYPHIVSGDSLTQVPVGDELVDWLAEGGQTIDVRNLWASRVSPVSTYSLSSMSLTVIGDRNCGAVLHQTRYPLHRTPQSLPQ